MGILKINNKLFKYNNHLCELHSEPEPISPFTLRLKYKEGTTPSFSKGTGVLVSPMLNIWDLTYENTNWDALLYNHSNLLEVILANTEGVTDMSSLFMGCRSLESVTLFDTSKVTSMNYMFRWCDSLITIPLFDTSKVTSMDTMFYNCYKVQTGALALYQQASTQANPPSSHNSTFKSCGSQTQTGAAELSQIPSDWK